MPQWRLVTGVRLGAPVPQGLESDRDLLSGEPGFGRVPLRTPHLLRVSCSCLLRFCALRTGRARGCLALTRLSFRKELLLLPLS